MSTELKALSNFRDALFDTAQRNQMTNDLQQAGITLENVSKGSELNLGGASSVPLNKEQSNEQGVC